MVRTLLLLFLMLTASPALACGILESAEPKVGSTVASIDQVTLHFSEAIVPEQSSVTITDESGGQLPAAKPVSQGNAFSVVLKRPLASGKYKVAWNVLWLDCGSKTQGDFKFSVR